MTCEVGMMRRVKWNLQDTAVANTHERIELVGGRLLRRVFLSGDVGEIRSNECVIFGDGRRSEGCLRDEFRAYVS